jgi:Photosynthesis system II assembly factor YCF48
VPLRSPTTPTTRESVPNGLSTPAASAPARAEFDASTARDNESSKLDQKAAPALPAHKPAHRPTEVSPKDSQTSRDSHSNEPQVADAIRAQDGTREKELRKQGSAVAGVGAPAPPAEEDENSITALSKVAPSPKAAAASTAKAQAFQAAEQQQGKRVVGGIVGASSSQTDVVELPANARSSVIITAPASNVLWRASPAGIIQRSTDTGSTWSVQTSGVVADLLAGSAPSDQVCWVVGRGGTIVRTTDGGENWGKIPSPTTDDLASIFALDAQQATVTSAYTRKSYKTVDAGQTWTSIPNP